MPTFVKAASILAISMLSAGTAMADSGHHDRQASEPRMRFDAIDMDGDRHEMMEDMMRMMMLMHGSSRMEPSDDPMSSASMRGMAMRDRDMMQMMMGPDMMDDMPGQVMQSRLEEYDSDGDGELSIDEFANWHAAMLRESMVDRFQHLDADGNGGITPDEMEAFAGRVNRMGGDAADGSMMRDDMNMDDDMDDRPMMRNSPNQN